jgi:type IV pilus assembly protein PilA
MSEAMVALAAAKTTVSEYVASTGNLPADGAAVGIPTVAADVAAAYTGDILERVGVTAVGDTVYIIANVYDSVWEGGTKSGTAVSSFQLVGVKAATSADLTWTCATGAGPTALLPIDTKYLPASCR